LREAFMAAKATTPRTKRAPKAPSTAVSPALAKKLAKAPVASAGNLPPLETRFAVGNPGRPKGSRNKLGEGFIAALQDDFAKHGAAVIEKVREENPATYLRVIMGVVPKSLLAAETSMGDLSDDEIAACLFVVRQALSIRNVADGRAEAAEGGEPAQLLPSISEATVVP
jgi:hypothetical protein